MALTRRDYTSDGVRTVYPIDFDLGYLRKEFVYVYLEDTPYTEQLEYTWVSRTEIELDIPVPNGIVLHIRRVVDRSELFNDYTNGALLSSKNLDDSFSQALMIEEEIQDGYLMPEGVVTLANEIIFEQAIHVQEPTEETNPTTKLYVDEAIAQAQQDAVDLKQYVDEADEVLQQNIDEAIAQVQQDAVDLKQYVDEADEVLQQNIDDLEVYVDDSVQDAKDYTDQLVANIDGVDGIVPQQAPRMLGDGVTTVFPTTADKQYPASSFQVYIDGVHQVPITDYESLPDGSIVFMEPPVVNSLVDVTLFQPSMVDNVATTASVLMVQKYINTDVTVQDPYNAVSVDPTIATGATVTVTTGSTYVVL